jgi:hypothetical protein
MQSVTMPRRMPSRRMACRSRVVSTAPVAPIGWPRYQACQLQIGRLG